MMKWRIKVREEHGRSVDGAWAELAAGVSAAPCRV